MTGTSTTPDPLIVPPETTITPVDTYPYNLGPWSRPILTSNPIAQTWFDRGLLWTYGFHHEEAVRCFQQSILADPRCSMALWGYAYARGPNYNRPYHLLDRDDLPVMIRSCRRACELAIKYAQDPLERSLADALIERFDDSPGTTFESRTKAWGDKMERVYLDHPKDLDITSIYADSRMNIAPWKLWDIHTGTPNENAHTSETRRILSSALHDARTKTHAGVLHLWIHLMELSPQPELALAPGDLLRGLIPDAGHLHHMPSHIDLLVGDYRRAISTNWEAHIADEKYASLTSKVDFYTAYRLHNLAIIVFAGMFNGQYDHAIRAAGKMESIAHHILTRAGGSADWCETVLSTRPHIYVRFGKWKEILELDFPEDEGLYCVTTATLHYARGVAHSVLGNIEQAEECQILFDRAIEAVPESRMNYPNNARQILKVGQAMLAGELEYRKGNYEIAFDHLRESIKRGDNLVYAEPSGWMQPPRHAYAALLMEQDRIEEASEVYAADLGLSTTLPRPLRHPNNVWALHGYHECLRRMGRDDAADAVQLQLDIALAVSDIPIKASCYCRSIPDKSEQAACCE